MTDKTHRRGRQAGLTLIETLVVLAVIGIASGMAMMGLNATDRGRQAEAEAVRLAHNLALGVDEAMLGGRPLALVWDADGYRFLAWTGDDAGWQPSQIALLGMRHDLRPPLELGRSDTSETAPVMIAPTGIGTPVRFRITGPGTDWAVDFDGFTSAARSGGGT